jgi:hypothetical protein
MRLKVLRSIIVLGLVVVGVTSLGACLTNGSDAPDAITYQGPVEMSIEPDRNLMGTDIRYIGITEDDRAEFQIDDKRALKKTGDSLNWEGHPAESVELSFKLRVLTISEEKVRTVGTVRVQIEEIMPEKATINEEIPVRISLPVTYHVANEKAIPGTTLTYQGEDEENGAQLGGLAEERYPYRRVGDSVVWEGRLCEGVFLRLNARVLYFSEETLRIGGVATLWIE